ncbi:MAG: hypothetical protein AB8B95_02170 [Pseudohongiellaceae bacterium]
MIFSLLKVRKKTAAAIAGITIGALCLWGVALWQDISVDELLSILFGTLLMLGAIMLAALAIIIALKLVMKLVTLLRSQD